MEIPQEANEYIREFIEDSLGLPVSERTLRLKLLASEDERHRLQDQIFVLQDQLKEYHKRLQMSREEASMNAQGLRKCIEEKQMMVVKYEEMEKYSSKLEKECMLYERDLEKAMETCDELEKENNELHVQLQDDTSVQALAAEVKSLQEDKENLRINLQKAEAEVKVLFEDNRVFDEENKKLLSQLHRERQRHGTGSKHSGNASASSARGKRKSSPNESSTAGKMFARNTEEDQCREPFSPLNAEVKVSCFSRSSSLVLKL